MTRDLLTLPLRLGLRVAGLALRPVASLAERALGLSGERQRDAAPYAPPVRPREPVRWDEPRAPRRPAAARPRPPAAEHVSEEPVVVAEVAETGAAEGPGPEVSVAEPWDGYRRMKAREIVARLKAATPEERAVVQLYEGTHRRRKTVLDASGYSQRK